MAVNEDQGTDQIEGTEELNLEEVESAPQENSEVEETPKAETSKKGKSKNADSTQVAPSVQGAAEANDGSANLYTPNYKYRVYDKELEFDEWLRGSIKNKEQEEKLRDIFTRAEAMPDLKEKYKAAQEYRTKYETTQKNINKIEKHLQSGDIESFFSAIGYQPAQTQQMLAKYVKGLIDQQEMPEEQRQQLLAHRQAQQRAMELEEKYSQAQTGRQELETRLLGMELEMTLNNPEFSDFVKYYDEKVGKPGAFKEEVIQEGHRRSLERGVTASPKEVVAEIVGKMRMFGGSPTAVQAQQQFPAKPKPTIPNMQTRGGSPAMKNFTSFEDIEKYREERWGS